MIKAGRCRICGGKLLSDVNSVIVSCENAGQPGHSWVSVDEDLSFGRLVSDLSAKFASIDKQVKERAGK